MVKNLPANAGDVGLIPEWGKFPGEGNGNPLQYSCLGNPMDRGAWWATVHGVSKLSQVKKKDTLCYRDSVILKSFWILLLKKIIFPFSFVGYGAVIIAWWGRWYQSPSEPRRYSMWEGKAKGDEFSQSPSTARRVPKQRGNLE